MTMRSHRMARRQPRQARCYLQWALAGQLSATIGSLALSESAGLLQEGRAACAARLQGRQEGVNIPCLPRPAGLHPG